MVRSYQAIWGEFQALFPELSRTIQKWKGCNWRLRVIALQGSNGALFRFQYLNEKSWFLYRVPLCDYDFSGGKK